MYYSWDYGQVAASHSHMAQIPHSKDNLDHTHLEKCYLPLTNYSNNITVINT